VAGGGGGGGEEGRRGVYFWLVGVRLVWEMEATSGAERRKPKGSARTPSPPPLSICLTLLARWAIPHIGPPSVHQARQEWTLALPGPGSLVPDGP
jgi:hypothetical protein